MNTLPTNEPVIGVLLRQILPLLPADLHEPLEREAPAVALEALSLGIEVMRAERQGISLSLAVERTAQFPLMGRVYWGMQNLLQSQVPPSIREAFRTMLNQAIAGKFDSWRRLLFAVSRRKGDPEAALCRFLIWSAVRVNLLIATWHQPQVEVCRVLDGLEDRTEEVLKELFDVSDVEEPDCRPLHMLVAIVLQEAYAAMKPLLMGGMTEIEAEMADALRVVRGLEARDAAMFTPGRSSGAIGSQQIVDRYPQHDFKTANAMEQRRSRIAKKPDQLPTVSDRVIDVIRDVAEGAQST
ncbi:MAG: hypothetical protein M0038_11430 [Pseudomonadota bacterium]|jgi:hypothetical protein|nr:hypothetical protein [Pseudomonadota bacterium]